MLAKFPSGLSIRLLRPLLAFGPLRRRLALALRMHHFADLDVLLPLSCQLNCPLALEQDLLSFSEIFFRGEYDLLLGQGPLPERWLDFGCHAGFFSLWLEWQRRRAGALAGRSSALLADADSRRFASVTRLLEFNQLSAQWKFLPGVIAAGTGERTFYERSYMSSSANPVGAEVGRAVSIPILTAERLRAIFPPPYDLIKLDIEGGEVDFLDHYEPIWREARQILLEWHGLQLGPGGENDLGVRLRAGGFANIRHFALNVRTDAVAVTTGLLWAERV
jgi:FkbM family methyltransferase